MLTTASQHVDLYRFPTRRFAYIFASVLPRHASHITRLDVPQFNYNEEPSSSDSERELDESEAEAILARRVADMDNPEIASQLALLLTRAIGGMTKLAAVRSVLSHLSDAFDKEFTDPEEGSPWTREILPAGGRNSSVAGVLADLGPRLRDLEVVGDDLARDGEDGFEYSEGRLAAFLANFPSLSRLDLDVSMREVGRHSLISTLSSFRHLTSLTLRGNDFLDDAFASAT